MQVEKMNSKTCMMFGGMGAKYMTYDQTFGGHVPSNQGSNSFAEACSARSGWRHEGSQWCTVSRSHHTFDVG